MTASHRPIRRILLLAALSLMSVDTATAQTPRGGSRLATRAELTATAQTLERAASSPAYSERLRARARAELGLVRQRLTVGDFRAGERILLRVDADEVLFDDTVTVLDSLVIDIPGVRRADLFGVLRSELEAKLTADVGTVVRNARVSARPLMRVAVFGDVGGPGFHAVPSETLLDQLLSLSGSPGVNASMSELRIVRGDTVLYDGPEVRDAIARGRTLDALSLRDGDALIVPSGSPPWDRAQTLQIVSLFSAPILALLLTR